MRIALDARKLTSSDSGIGNYTLNLARALLEEDKDLELLLLCNGPRGQRLWQGPRVKEVIFPFPDFTRGDLPYLDRDGGRASRVVVVTRIGQDNFCPVFKCLLRARLFEWNGGGHRRPRALGGK